MSVLVIGELQGQELRPVTRNAVTAAMQMGTDVHVLICGANVESAARAAASISGVSKVLVADAPQFGQATAEIVSAQVLAVMSASPYSHLVAAATGFGKARCLGSPPSWT